MSVILDVEGNYPYFDNYYGAIDHFNRENINLVEMYRVYTTDAYAEVRIHNDMDNYRYHALFLGRAGSNGGMYPQRIASIGARHYYVSPTMLIDADTIVFECLFKQLNSVQRGEKVSIGLFSSTPTSYSGNDDAFSNNTMIALRYDGGDNYTMPKDNYEIVYCNDNGSVTVVNSGLTRDSNEHRVRIVWSVNKVDFYIDGILKHSINNSNMIPSRALLPAFAVRNARTSVALDVRLIIDYWHIYFLKLNR
jgi:hypothetical protein